MNRMLAPLIAFTLLFGGHFANAKDGDDDGPSIEEQMAKIVKLGAGVHNVQKDKKGHIVSCVVVGQARISTSLGKSKGLELARNKANLDCSAQFVKWLKEEARIYESNEDGTVLLMEGEEGSDEKETGKSIENASKKMDTVSKGLVRGLQVLHKDVDGGGKNLTIIKGWKADNSEGVKKIAADSASDEPAGKKEKSGKSDSASDEADSKKTKDKTIDSESETSEDAADFFPKKKKK